MNDDLRKEKTLDELSPLAKNKFLRFLKKKREKRLEILERYNGFLGIIIALVLTITWDFVSSSKFETVPEDIRLAALFSYNMQLILLGTICVFYFLLFLGYDDIAEGLGFCLMIFFLFVLYLAILPLISYYSFGIFMSWAWFLGGITCTFILMMFFPLTFPLLEKILEKILSKFKD